LTFRPAVAGERAAALLIHESFAEFYGLLPLDGPARIEAIAEQVASAGTELSDTVLAVTADQVVGGFAALPAGRLRDAQMLSVARLAAHVSGSARAQFMSKVQAFRVGVPSVPPESFYLARIAVAATMRGKNIGGRMLDRFATQGAGYTCLSVHVSATSKRAVEFYKAHGFTEWGAPSAYLALVREPAT